jgi:hypothetical protein
LQLCLRNFPVVRDVFSRRMELPVMRHRGAQARKWILPVLVSALIGGHGLILYQLHSHLASTAVVP